MHVTWNQRRVMMAVTGAVVMTMSAFAQDVVRPAAVWPGLWGPSSDPSCPRYVGPTAVAHTSLPVAASSATT